MKEEVIARGRGSERRQSIGVSGPRRGAWISPIVGVAVSCCVAISTARAQSVTREEFNDRVNEAINGVTIFTSQDSASSGVFSLDSDAPGEGDRDIDILKLPVTYTFGEEGDTFRPQVRAVVGSFRSSYSPKSRVEGEMNDFSRTEATTGGVAGGVVYNPWKELRVTPLVGIAYTHLKRWYDFNNSFSQANYAPFDREAFNTSVDVMTYSPTLEVDYTFKIERATLIPKVRYTHLFNNSFASKSSVIDVDSDSGMLQTFVDAQVPLGYSVYEFELGLHPYIVRTDIYGSARSATGPDYFHELGADLTFNQNSDRLIDGFYVGGSYITGEDFSGYRLGLGLMF